MAIAAPRLAACPVENLRDYLSGAWRLARVYIDCRHGRVGRLRGVARFAAAADGLHYGESGRLRFGDFEGEAYREYRYRFPAPGAASVLLADGRPFHDLDLSAGRWQVRYDCARDRYEGEFLARSPACWRVAWRVSGPRKDLIIRSSYRR